jgi:hypothetical protein
MYFCTSVYFKTSEKKTPTDPDNISKGIYKQACYEVCFESGCSIWKTYPPPHRGQGFYHIPKEFLT